VVFVFNGLPAGVHLPSSDFIFRKMKRKMKSEDDNNFTAMHFAR